MNELFNDNGGLIDRLAWKNIDNHKKYAEVLGERLGYTKPEHWYQISGKDIRNNNGSTLLVQYYDNSHIQFVQTVIKLIYPKHEWLEWNFNKAPQHFWDLLTNQKKYMDWLFNKLEYNKMDDWYNLNINILRKNNAGGLINKYNNSHIQLLTAVYTEHEWLEWKFKYTSNKFWSNPINHKKFTDWLGKKLGYIELDHWYSITRDIIFDNGGDTLLQRYYNSLIELLREVYPEHAWVEWKFGMTQHGFWQNTKNHKIYADWLGKQLGYTTPEDWYKITSKLIFDNYGCGLLSNYYQGSPIKFLREVYPEHEWLEWLFGICSHGFWEDVSNHKIYANWLGKQLEYTEPKHWYSITTIIIQNNYGGGILKYYQHSPIRFIRGVYPEYAWLEWQFDMCSIYFWKDINNHKIYADWLGKELGYTELAHWYNITQDIIFNKNGRGMLNCHNGSPIRFLRKVYPEYEWLAWKFGTCTSSFWQDISNHKIYAVWLGKELGYTEPEHWYNITRHIINKNYGRTLFKYYKSYTDIPKLVYPNYNWEENKFCFHKTEMKLYEILLSSYHTVLYQFKPEWIKPKSFDFCIPEYNIIIELDGRQHFEQVPKWRTPEEEFENDKYKEDCANDNGYSVIRIVQEDVFNDTYDWKKYLYGSIEEIKNSNEIANIYLYKNDEYDAF